MTGVAMGAGTSLWVERRLRRSVQQAAARLQPDALIAEAGRNVRQAAENTGQRVRDAIWSGRDEMRRREEELWADLAGGAAVRPSVRSSVSPSVSSSARTPGGDETASEPDRAGRRPRYPTKRSPGSRSAISASRAARPGAKPPLHLGK